MKLLVFWYCDSFCNCQMLCLVGSYDPTKTYLGIFWRVIMFGYYTVAMHFFKIRILSYSSLIMSMAETKIIEITFAPLYFN